MANKTIDELEQIDITNHSDKERQFLPIYSEGTGTTRKLNFLDLAEMLWDKMYISFKKVIVTCSYCGSANSITNSNCIQCGAGLGKDIQGD